MLNVGESSRPLRCTFPDKCEWQTPPSYHCQTLIKIVQERALTLLDCDWEERMRDEKDVNYGDLGGVLKRLTLSSLLPESIAFMYSLSIIYMKVSVSLDYLLDYSVLRH